MELKQNLKKMISYYGPYKHIFWADMFFATLSAGVALVIPLVVRYVTRTLIYLESSEIMRQIPLIAL
ncbi:MAG: ABC transporter ATP-binding protein, partial [Acetatifactor sp.]|nr:ABC transporter ATP-binding protein [Acetatifactor sp.]